MDFYTWRKNGLNYQWLCSHINTQKNYHIKVSEGVRGMNIPVNANVEDGVWQVSLDGKKLTVIEVAVLVPKLVPKMVPKK